MKVVFPEPAGPLTHVMDVERFLSMSVNSLVRERTRASLGRVIFAMDVCVIILLPVADDATMLPMPGKGSYGRVHEYVRFAKIE